MESHSEILHRIKYAIHHSAPQATVILYGSYARGDNTPDSDIDLLILLDQPSINREVEQQIAYPLYDIEFETGQIISPLILSRSDWETRHCITPFYENVQKDGIAL